MPCANGKSRDATIKITESCLQQVSLDFSSRQISAASHVHWFFSDSPTNGQYRQKRLFPSWNFYLITSGCQNDTHRNDKGKKPSFCLVHSSDFLPASLKFVLRTEMVSIFSCRKAIRSRSWQSISMILLGLFCVKHCRPMHWCLKGTQLLNEADMFAHTHSSTKLQIPSWETSWNHSSSRRKFK